MIQTDLGESAFLRDNKQYAEVRFHGEINLWFCCFTQWINVWSSSAPLTFFLKLWLPFEASMRSLSLIGDVIQTYFPADSFKSQTARQTFIIKILITSFVQYKPLNENNRLLLPVSASLSLLLSITQLKLAARKAISVPLCWFFFCMTAGLLWQHAPGPPFPSGQYHVGGQKLWLLPTLNYDRP